MVWTSADERAKNSEGYKICSLCRNRSLFIVRSCKFLSFFSIVAKCRLLQIDGLTYKSSISWSRTGRGGGVVVFRVKERRRHGSE